MRLKYTVPSRLTLDLYDMNGSLGRVDGSCCFSLNFPNLVFTIELSEVDILENEQILDPELIEAVYKAMHEIKKRFNTQGVKICFEQTIPAHRGFGSKTATVLSIGHAICAINKIEITFHKLALLLKRGGTSGAGVNLIDHGGFIVDGGHSTQYKKSFKPSSAVNEITIAPILARYDMPDWDILLIVPKLEKVYGNNEVNFFDSICPLPDSDIEKVARITLSLLMPAVVESDLKMFCTGINNIQKQMWKKGEIGLYGDPIQTIMNIIHECGDYGVGMSSMGTCVYVFGNDLIQLKRKVEMTFPNTVEFEMIRIVKANNKGLTIEKN